MGSETQSPTRLGRGCIPAGESSGQRGASGPTRADSGKTQLALLPWVCGSSRGGKGSCLAMLSCREKKNSLKVRKIETAASWNIL